MGDCLFPCCFGRASKEYDQLKADPSVKHPEKHMLRQRRNGLYQGCFSKSHWGHKRVAHRWDLFAEIAPNQAKRCYELPNYIRSLLGIEEKKHDNSKFKKEDGNHKVPMALVTALESLLMERIHLGEEVTSDYAAETLLMLVQLWNEKIKELNSDVVASHGTEVLKSQDKQITDETSDDQIERMGHQASSNLESVLSTLKSCHVQRNHTAITILGCKHVVV